MRTPALGKRFVFLSCALILCAWNGAAQNREADGLLRIAIDQQNAGRFDSAVVIGLQSYSLARDKGDAVTLQSVCSVLAESFEARGDHRQAYTFHLEATALKDSLVDESNLKSINEISALYEAEKKEQKIALLEKDRSLQELELKRRQSELLRHALEQRQRKQQVALLGKEKKIESLTLASTRVELDRQRLQNMERASEVELLSKDNQLQASLLERETSRRNAFVAGAVLLLLLSAVLFNRYRYKQRMTEQLTSTLARLRQTQAQLIHSEKMSTLGEMTAGIAHEIKNPLNFVTNFSAISTDLTAELYRRLDRPDAVQTETDRRELSDLIDAVLRNTEKVTEHGKRADMIISNMMMHARREAGVRQRVDINRLVDDAVTLAKSGQRVSIEDAAVEIRTVFDPRVKEEEVLPQEMARVVLNLVSNAIYAARQRSATDTVGGQVPGHESASVLPTVWIETERRDKSIELRVRDNGPGIPEEIKSRIFQPFFTTKPTGEGTGLGLSMSYDIVVNGHGGTLQYRSGPEGTVFIVTFPGT